MTVRFDLLDVKVQLAALRADGSPLGLDRIVVLGSDLRGGFLPLLFHRLRFPELCNFCGQNLCRPVVQVTPGTSSGR